MNKDSEAAAVLTDDEDDLRDEYDFSQMTGGVRGKYAAQYRKGTNVVLLAPDVAAAFPTEQAVNEALRKLIAQKSSA
jgi:hypothetical protein